MPFQNLQIGICAAGEAARGWARILQQEGLPHVITPEPVGPITVLAGALPAWLEPYVARGGIAVISGAHSMPEVLPASTPALLHRFLPPGAEKPAYAPGMVQLFEGEGEGQCHLHENRKVRDGNVFDRFPVVLTKPLGRGYLVFTGIPLCEQLMVRGDMLRRFSPYSEISERVSSVDKADVADTLVWMLMKAFALARLPYVRLPRFPADATSVLIFRVDGDGVFGDHALRLAQTAAACGIRASFYFNGALSEQHPGRLEDWSPHHELGQHGYSHDIYGTAQANVHNLVKGADWFERTFGRRPECYVAPRGLWNDGLETALAQLKYPYSSDFGLEFDSLPFRTAQGILQIPPHPFSPERAAVYTEELGLDPLTPDFIASYYINVFHYQRRHSRPAYVYGHPQVLGGMAEDVLPRLAAAARAERVPNLTVGEFHQFWINRERVGMTLEYDEQERVLVVGVSGERALPIQIVAADGRAPVRIKQRPG